MPDTRASNPTSSGPSLLDKSTARPADVDMAIFEKNQAQSGSPSAGASQKSQGAVNSNYLEECRRDNPSPTDEKSAKRTVTLSDCRIDTPKEDLATDQPFKMSCMATSSDGKPVTSGVTFRLYCSLPDGTEEDTGLAKVGKREGDRICAEGTLYSPKKLVEWGAPLKYHVAADSPDSEAVESDRHDVITFGISGVIGVWNIGDEYFIPGTSQIRVEASEKIESLQSIIDSADWIYRVSIFGHSATEGDSIKDATLSRQRALAVYGLLTREIQIWKDSNNELGFDQCSKFEINPSYFLGSSSDPKHQWAVNACGNVNPFVSKLDGESECAINSRVTVFVFKSITEAPRMRLPCRPTLMHSPPCKGLKMDANYTTPAPRQTNGFGCDAYASFAYNEREPTTREEQAVTFLMPASVFVSESAEINIDNDQSNGDHMSYGNPHILVETLVEIFKMTHARKSMDLMVFAMESQDEHFHMKENLAIARAETIAAILRGNREAYVSIVTACLSPATMAKFFDEKENQSLNLNLPTLSSENPTIRNSARSILAHQFDAVTEAISQFLVRDGIEINQAQHHNSAHIFTANGSIKNISLASHREQPHIFIAPILKKSTRNESFNSDRCDE